MAKSSGNFKYLPHACQILVNSNRTQRTFAKNLFRVAQKLVKIGNHEFLHFDDRFFTNNLSKD